MAGPGQPFPIAGAPAEILDRIFDAAVCSFAPPEEEYWGEGSRGDQRGAQRTALRLISPRWNQILLNNPRFWNDIVLDFSMFDPPWDPPGIDHNDDDPYVDSPQETNRMEEAFDMVRTHLVRGGALPKRLYLIQPGKEIPRYDEVDDPRITRERYDLCDFLISTSEVWDAVWIELDHHHGFISYLFNYQRRWTSLRSLTLKSTERVRYGEGSSEEPEVGMLVMQPMRFPSLRHLSIDMTMVKLEGWHLPWGQLTSLKLRALNAGFNDYLSVLARASNTEIFHLAISEDGPGDGFSAPPAPGTFIDVPRLREVVLDLPREVPTITGDFLDKLTLPALRSFTLRGKVPIMPFRISFESLLGRSRVVGRNLHLDFEGCNLPADVVAQFQG